MTRKFIFACTLITVLSAGAVSFKQISTAPKYFPGCSTFTCTAANPHVCGICICNLPQGVCTRDPIGAK